MCEGPPSAQPPPTPGRRRAAAHPSDLAAEWRRADTVRDGQAPFGAGRPRGSRRAGFGPGRGAGLVRPRPGPDAGPGHGATGVPESEAGPPAGGTCGGDRRPAAGGRPTTRVRGSRALPRRSTHTSARPEASLARSTETRPPPQVQTRAQHPAVRLSRFAPPPGPPPPPPCAAAATGQHPRFPLGRMTCAGWRQIDRAHTQHVSHSVSNIRLPDCPFLLQLGPPTFASLRLHPSMLCSPRQSPHPNPNPPPLCSCHPASDPVLLQPPLQTHCSVQSEVHPIRRRG